MNGTTHNGLDAKSADGHDVACSHRWCGEGCGRLCQGESVPAERAAACLNDPTCKLVGRIKACANDQQLFCWSASLQPSPGTSNAAILGLSA